MAETKIHDDFHSYEPRNIFGALSKRQAIAAAACIVVMSGAVYGIWRYNLPLEPTVIAGALICAPVGTLAMAPMRGLHAEKWVPIVVRDKTTVDRMLWGPKRVVIEVEEKKPTASERRRARREEKLAKHERDCEGEHDGPDMRDLIERGRDRA